MWFFPKSMPMFWKNYLPTSHFRMFGTAQKLLHTGISVGVMHALQVMPPVIKQAAASQGGLLRIETIFVRWQFIYLSVYLRLSVSAILLLDIEVLEYSSQGQTLEFQVLLSLRHTLVRWNFKSSRHVLFGYFSLYNPFSYDLEKHAISVRS